MEHMKQARISTPRAQRRRHAKRRLTVSQQIPFSQIPRHTFHDASKASAESADDWPFWLAVCFSVPYSRVQCCLYENRATGYLTCYVFGWALAERKRFGTWIETRTSNVVVV